MDPKTFISSTSRVMISEDEIDGFRIVIQPGRNRDEIGRYLLIVVVLMMFCVPILFTPPKPKMSPGALSALRLIVSANVVIGAVAVFFGYRWEQVSHEIIRIEGHHLVIRREAQPFAAIHRSRTFDLAEIRDLRHDPLQPTPSFTIPSRAFGKGGEIAFEARDKTFRDTTFRFGLDLTIGDLDRIIEQLQLRIDRVVLK